ncbi:MAG TPA: hypothetical protein VFU22_27305 [Roseiflexaceae bacterium]|nr:hypothetical protein [Roseiflexaceae bacterium]
MRPRLAALGLALLLAGLLALIVTGAINDVLIVPLLFLWWAAQILYQSLPQALLWGIFVAIAVLLMVKSLPWNDAPLPARDPGLGEGGRVTDWSRLLHESSRDEHGRWRLAQRLAQLTVETLAFREQCPPQQISRRLGDGSLDITPQLRAYLRAGSLPYAPAPKDRRRHGRLSTDAAPADPLALDTQQLVAYLEDTLQYRIGDAQ